MVISLKQIGSLSQIGCKTLQLIITPNKFTFGISVKQLVANDEYPTSLLARNSELKQCKLFKVRQKELPLISFNIVWALVLKFGCKSWLFTIVGFTVTMPTPFSLNCL